MARDELRYFDPYQSRVGESTTQESQGKIEVTSSQTHKWKTISIVTNRVKKKMENAERQYFVSNFHNR